MFDNSMQIILALFSGYVVTSMILLKNPTILYRKKKIKFTSRHISHRGGAGENYENTLTAFKRAVAVGTDMLELDCQITKDNQVVVCHDNNLFRITGLNINVGDLNYNELPLLKTTIPIEFDPGVSFTGNDKPEDRKIPLLNEVFEHFPSMPMNIDVKVNNDLLLKEVNKLIIDHRREKITVWGNTSDEITSKCYKLNPNINLLFSFRQVVRLFLLFYTGLLPFFPIKETHFEIFQPSMYLRPEWKLHSHENFYVQLPSFVISTLDSLVMSKTLFRHLTNRGIQTYVWVLNYDHEYKTVFDLGVTGVMTDYPTKLKKFLNENPSYKL